MIRDTFYTALLIAVAPPLLWYLSAPPAPAQPQETQASVQFYFERQQTQGDSNG